VQEVGMSSWQRLWGPVVASLALILLDPQMARAEPGVPVPPNGLLPDKAQGTLSAADKDFVTKVRLAGLWEIPAGDMAQEKSDDPRIREIGKTISGQHVVLDQLTRVTAKKLKIDLPDTPNSDQQKWLGEMRDASGTDFGTRNDAVRLLAQQANQFVMTHMTLLESSNIVDYQTLPTVPAPSASASAPVLSAADQRPAAPPVSNMPYVIAALGLGVIGGALLTRQLLKGSRRRGYRPRY
jgi:putative membrane protein